MLNLEPTQRFSSRVDNYARCRPSYPQEIINVLHEECGLSSESVVADIASGTGIFTRLLLENGNRVLAVEPNPEMRRAGEEYLAAYPGFTSIAGTAEATTLPDDCVHLITSAQAAHWFDREKAIREFQRILKPGGFLALMWNDRRVDATAFDHDYEELLVKYGTDYEEVKRRDKAAGGFFGSFRHEKRVLPNFQDLDYAALEGRLLSSSYIPQPGHPSYAAMVTELRRILDTHQVGGRVRMEYDTKLYFGQLPCAE
jgi:ubiquinone/menaquinone biosynthesis C-methylase UbiE